MRMLTSWLSKVLTNHSTKMGVGLSMVTIWLELSSSYSSSCHHHLLHPCSTDIQNGHILVPGDLGLPGKMAVKPETERKRDTLLGSREWRRTSLNYNKKKGYSLNFRRLSIVWRRYNSVNFSRRYCADQRLCLDRVDLVVFCTVISTRSDR